MPGKCDRCLNEAGIHCTDVPERPPLELLINGNSGKGRILFQNGAWRLGQLDEPIDQCPIVNGEVSPEKFWDAVDYFTIEERRLVKLSPNEAGVLYRRARIRTGYP